MGVEVLGRQGFPWADASPLCPQEHLISKAQLMHFLKAFPSVLTQY